MNQLANYCQLFVFILLIFLALYLILSGTAYWILYIAKGDRFKARKIQKRFPARKIIFQEIKWSVIGVVVMSFFTTILVTFISRGYSKTYYDVQEYGWFYFFGSIVLCIFINDAYFYWMHRFMHLKTIFPFVHKIHHLSNTPDPWSIFSFSPIETTIQYAIYPLMIFFIPLLPVSIGIIVMYNILMNLGGHLGYEVVPLRFHKHWLLKYSLTVTHHEMHHSKVKCNYGLYFNLWDRLMKTNHAEYEKKFMEVQDQIKNSALLEKGPMVWSSYLHTTGKTETMQGDI
jgi:Delta7-sterol 5-desaturase